uniref:Uncharacterized protein LOC114338318 n=1 Tax=Diabrotica virgifera virgifera TaxID=50390 RepID=A0A6P7GLQ4_DIAVI
MEISGERNQIRKFFREVKTVRQDGNVGVTQAMRNEAGELIMMETEIVERWKEYFRNLLNIESEMEESETTFHSADVEIPPPTLQEVKNAIASLKDHKAPGNDGINGELIKKGGNVLHQKLYDIILRVWQQQKMPRECNGSETHSVFGRYSRRLPMRLSKWKVNHRSNIYHPITNASFEGGPRSFAVTRAGPKPG